MSLRPVFVTLLTSMIFLILGCSGGKNMPSNPTITSFTVNPTNISAGGTTQLSGVFSNGTGVITPESLTISSGQSVSSAPTTTTYTLTVTNSVPSASPAGPSLPQPALGC